MPDPASLDVVVNDPKIIVTYDSIAGELILSGTELESNRRVNVRFGSHQTWELCKMIHDTCQLNGGYLGSQHKLTRQ